MSDLGKEFGCTFVNVIQCVQRRQTWECGRDALPLIVSRNQRHVTNHKIEVRTTYERRCDQQAGELIKVLVHARCKKSAPVAKYSSTGTEGGPNTSQCVNYAFVDTSTRYRYFSPTDTGSSNRNDQKGLRHLYSVSNERNDIETKFSICRFWMQYGIRSLEKSCTVI